MRRVEADPLFRLHRLAALEDPLAGADVVVHAKRRNIIGRGAGGHGEQKGAILSGGRSHHREQQTQGARKSHRNPRPGGVGG